MEATHGTSISYGSTVQFYLLLLQTAQLPHMKCLISKHYFGHNNYRGY